LPHDLQIVTVNGGEGTSQYHTRLAVAKFTGKRKKIQSYYFIATPRIPVSVTSMVTGLSDEFVKFILLLYISPILY
jgi:hypothetical protein